MIGFLPEIYPDELVYSYLARYYVRSGYINYTFFAENIYVNKNTVPDIEFFNTFTKELLNVITKNYSLDYLIKNHTMFNCYARFIKYEKRKQAYTAMRKMEGGYYNLLSIPVSKVKRYLRYCPECAKEDREKYGETYWHRLHQMMGVNVCTKHKCYLVDSEVAISSNASPMLKSAEQEIRYQDEKSICNNEVEYQISEYVGKVFESKLFLNNKICAGEFLNSKLSNTKYKSVRGKQRNIELLCEDFNKYYSELKDNNFKESWQIGKVLSNYRTNTYEICLLAMFLNISASELTNMKLPEKTQEELFDEEVKRLRDKGLKYPEIAKFMNASYNVVKPIGENLYGKYRVQEKCINKGGVKKKNWNSIDNEMLSKVKDAIKELFGDGITRPKRITKSSVAGILGVYDKIFNNLPICKQEIEKYYESYEEYWAREVEWAVKTIQREGQTLTLTRVLEYINLRRENFDACIPYLKKGSAIWELI